MVAQIDREKLTAAILAAEVSGPAKEEGARLVEHWLEKLTELPEFKWRVRFVEAPFYIQLQPKTWIVGQMDACFEDDGSWGTIFGEWKSRRAPKLKKDGTNYAGDDQDGWLEEISNGPQLGVYALAGREGTFIDNGDVRYQTILGISEPHILVRAAVKSNPVELWSGQFSFPGVYLDTVKAALISEAESIRARRRAKHLPWALPSMHCTNMYRRSCEFLKDCQERKYALAEPAGWHPTDPGFKICEILGLDFKDEELVVLSASGYQESLWCPERWRRLYGGHEKGEEDFNLATGTVLHAGLASIYQQLCNGPSGKNGNTV